MAIPLPETACETQMSKLQIYATRSGLEGQIWGINLGPLELIRSSDGNRGPF